MKLNHAIHDPDSGRVIQKFGQAKLVRYTDGKHELIGGSTADVAEAKEWVSLIAHEIVFSRPGCKPIPTGRAQRKFVSFQFRSGVSP